MDANKIRGEITRLSRFQSHLERELDRLGNRPGTQEWATLDRAIHHIASAITLLSKLVAGK